MPLGSEALEVGRERLAHPRVSNPRQLLWPGVCSACSRLARAGAWLLPRNLPSPKAVSALRRFVVMRYRIEDSGYKVEIKSRYRDSTCDVFKDTATVRRQRR